MNAESHIRELVQVYLADDRKGDLVRFLDELLTLAVEVGEVAGQLAGEGGLRLYISTLGQRT